MRKKRCVRVEISQPFPRGGSRRHFAATYRILGRDRSSPEIDWLWPCDSGASRVNYTNGSHNGIRMC